MPALKPLDADGKTSVHPKLEYFFYDDNLYP
jgi:hypothetical protein